MRRVRALSGYDFKKIHAAGEAFVPNAFVFDFDGRRGDHRYIYILRVRLRNYFSRAGGDLNPRPVAAATALP